MLHVVALLLQLPPLLRGLWPTSPVLLACTSGLCRSRLVPAPASAMDDNLCRPSAWCSCPASRRGSSPTPTPWFLCLSDALADMEASAWARLSPTQFRLLLHSCAPQSLRRPANPSRDRKVSSVPSGPRLFAPEQGICLTFSGLLFPFLFRASSRASCFAPRRGSSPLQSAGQARPPASKNPGSCPRHNASSTCPAQCFFGPWHFACPLPLFVQNYRIDIFLIEVFF